MKISRLVLSNSDKFGSSSIICTKNFFSCIEISNLIDANDSIILTRYYHPINHLSIGNGKKVAINFGATHPSHCLNTKSNACPRNENLGLTNKEINSI
jgi:hypothetical protein